MAAPTVAELRAALAANLGTIADVQVSAYMLASPTPPALHVIPAAVDYDSAMHRGMDSWTFTIQGFVAMATDIGAQKTLDLMLAPSGATSVKAAVEADATLGGKCDDLRVTNMSGYKQFVFDGKPPMLGAEWTVTVIALGA